MQMSALPTPLQQLDSRPFAFHPPIRHAGHNEWLFRRGGWTDIVVVNRHSGQEASIPLLFLGEISHGDHPAVIVGLRRELELRGGAVRPRSAAVIQLPRPEEPGDIDPGRPRRLAPVVSIRLERRRGMAASRKIAVAAVIGVIAALLAQDIVRQLLRSLDRF